MIAAAALALGAGGYGAKDHSSTHSHSYPTATGNLHRGEFCSKHEKSLYKRAGFTCEKVHGSYRLQ